ncbi:MAG: P63C domain-containing protein [Acidobacteriia bacterium]|nr:P63C domain-containing protein [Terriglobia bacterium]
MESRNPKDDRGRRPVTHHMWLTEDIGHPALAQHLYALNGFMRASSTWNYFYDLVQRAFPRKGTTLLALPFPENDR